MNPEESPLKQIRTFQGDVTESLQKQRESLVSIQQAEHLRGSLAGSPIDTSSENFKSRKELFLLLLGSVLLFALGTVGIWYAYNEFVRKTATPISSVPANRFISTNTEINLDFTAASREILINTLAGATGNTTRGELNHIVFRKGAEDKNPLLTTSEFLQTLESRAPGSLVRAFDPLFMFGNFGASAFLVIKLASFENAFAGMLAWEKDLDQDIGPLFATAELLRNISSETSFTDVTDRNKDIRMLTLEGQIVLLYSFFDNNMLIITDDLETLRVLIDRLTREKLSR